jgi:hypothetical protein
MAQARNDVQGFRDAHARYLGARASGEMDKRPWPVYMARPRAVDNKINAALRRLGKGASRRDYFGLSANGAMEGWAVIVDERGEVLEAYNYSWLCPPICETVAT